MKPSELSLTIACLPIGYSSDGWAYADEVRGRLVLLGFEASAQQTAAWLTRMARADAPWVERRESSWGDWQYRVTPYGKSDLDNRLGLSVRLPWVPTMRGAA